MQDWLGMPVPAAAHAGDVDQIMRLVHWLMLVLFFGWSAFFVFVLIRFRRSRQPAEVVLLAFFSIPLWSARVDALPAERDSTVVRVIADQFAWNVHYPGADGVFGRTDIRLVGPDNPIGSIGGTRPPRMTSPPSTG